MRFTNLLPALALLSSVLGRASPATSPNPRYLVNRALANVNACVTVAVGTNVPPIVVPVIGSIKVAVQETLCLCTVNAVGGPVATATSATAISNALSRDTGITVTTLPVAGPGVTTSITVGALNDLLRPLGLDLTSLFINALIQALPAVVPVSGTNNACANYPTSGTFEPVAPTTAQCGDCFFRCTGTTPFLCPNTSGGGRFCSSTECSGPSAGAITMRRWLANQANVDLLCPTGLTACAIPGRSVKAGLKVDCLDTKSDVETCGGCEFPLHGQPKGVDCSVIDNAGSVSCVNGQCIVHSCRPGFVLVGSDCVRALKIE